MSQTFSFSFGGDDIEASSGGEESSPQRHQTHHIPTHSNTQAAETGSLARRHAPSTPASQQPRNSAFPIAGQVLLPALAHNLEELLATLPSRICYGGVDVGVDPFSSSSINPSSSSPSSTSDLCPKRTGSWDGNSNGNSGGELRIPRREMWDVRMQLMAEADTHAGGEGGRDGDGDGNEEGGEGEREVALGKEDVKTGVYEGGFKSWESSVDLVKVLAGRKEVVVGTARREVLEMGCGTALPSLALLQWHLSQNHAQPPNSTNTNKNSSALTLKLADYNPSVLQLVTLPNLLLSWAQWRAGASWAPEGDLDIDTVLLDAFRSDLRAHHVSLSFYSGTWGPEFVRLVTAPDPVSLGIVEEMGEGIDGNGNCGLGVAEEQEQAVSLLVLAAETIYSPVALKAFAESLVDVLRSKGGNGQGEREALVAAKKVYFGVGGSIEDFVTEVEARGAVVVRIREEEEGVRRAVVGVRIGEGATGRDGSVGD